MDALQVEKYLDPTPYMGICRNLNILYYFIFLAKIRGHTSLFQETLSFDVGKIK